MESIPLRRAISATNQSFLLRRQSLENQFQSSSQRFHLHTPTRRFRIHSKLSGFQDSKGYAKPSRLLPATEVKICTDNSVEKLFSAMTDLSLYTSLKGYRRVLSVVTDHATDSKNGVLHFQRGSVDQLTFEGTKLGKIEAVWISLESVLDRLEQRLEDIFEGRPYDILDAALTNTVSNFPLDIKPFRDMIEGMRMDMVKCRYQNFQELYLYCYYVAGTVGLMSVPVMGIVPDSLISAQRTYDSALYLGIGNQLTNILRDVGEDAMRGRVYLPQDELAQFGLCDNDVLSRKVTDQWRAFMKEQITRARFYFNLAEEGASQLDKASRWPVWSSLLIYRNILDAIEDNDYDNLTKRAYVKRAKKLLMLPLAYTRSLSTRTLMSK